MELAAYYERTRNTYLLITMSIEDKKQKLSWVLCPTNIIPAFWRLKQKD
jgi:hypothetical protein